MKKNKLAILISSYDGAEDLWYPLEQSYRKYWSDNPYKIYLATNHKKPNLEIFNILDIGNEKSWSDNILKCLERIEEDYILLTFDDLFFYTKLDTETISGLINKAINLDWDYFRLHPSPTADELFDDDAGLIYCNRPYRASTVFSIIKKEVFKDLLVETESAWEFERNGSIRSCKYKKFYVSNKTVIPYLNGVVKGKWIPTVLEQLKSDGLYIQEDKRSVMTQQELMMEKIKRMRLKIFLKAIPKPLQLKIRQFIK